MGQRPLDQLDEIFRQSEPSKCWHGGPLDRLLVVNSAGPEQGQEIVLFLILGRIFAILKQRVTWGNPED
jgi:hypothetical protein